MFCWVSPSLRRIATPNSIPLQKMRREGDEHSQKNGCGTALQKGILQENTVPQENRAENFTPLPSVAAGSFSKINELLWLDGGCYL